ncbi:Cytochrome P450 76T24 [Camellia lanceoleosa]|uniref:Cytochrome P450 76T24 n=1 Tax=Camellia lanceoleosa TaxID=1840588 RepID=A0ACC0IRP4_9ERIC|nr:Cytochrome P450 76T24 [Camellia lanceoleosa]
MDYLTLLLVLSFVWICIHVFRSSSAGRAGLPPGPNPFPIIGNILALGKRPHESLSNLSKIYGPLMSLKLGTMTTIVVSSPSIAEQVLQKHDQIFSSRTLPNVVQVLNHHKASIVWSSALSPWRNLRKICKEHVFSTRCLDANRGLRQKKVRELLDYVKLSCENGQEVDIGKAAFTTTLNLLSSTFFSIDIAHHNSNFSQEFKDLVWALMEIAGKPNIADFLPLFKLIDPQGLQGQTRRYMQRLFDIFDGIINQRLQLRASVSPPTVDDFLEVLLNLGKENDTQLSCNDIKHLFLDLFVAGTDTTSSTVEWAMAELLKKPKILAKAQAELKEVICNDGIVQEADISRLPYLQAVVKEILRLHPPAPLLVPHKAEANVEISGFMVPKNAQVLVNVWAIGRDSSIWLHPDSFVPERFLDLKVDMRGQDFELIPFGAGRRICPGIPLAYQMVHFMLASLLHSFDWKLGGGMESKDIDMSEKFGITLRKTIPLKAIPISN